MNKRQTFWNRYIIRVSLKFCNILLVCASLQCVYYVTEVVQVMEGTRVVVGSIVVVGVPTCCALLHFMCNLKATQMNVQHSLIGELTIYKFKLSHNFTEATQKSLLCERWRCRQSQYSNQMIARTRQGEIDLKMWIPKPCHSLIVKNILISNYSV